MFSAADTPGSEGGAIVMAHMQNVAVASRGRNMADFSSRTEPPAIIPRFRWTNSIRSLFSLSFGLPLPVSS